MSTGDDRIFEVVQAVHDEMDEAESASPCSVQKDPYRAIVDILTRFEFKPSRPKE